MRLGILEESPKLRCVAWKSGADDDEAEDGDRFRKAPSVPASFFVSFVVKLDFTAL